VACALSRVITAPGLKARVRDRVLGEVELPERTGVVLTTQYTNLSPLLAGAPIRLSERHAKVRRGGYHNAG
jgi:hypothetical protein